ncbi:MAG: NAD-dependent epimerase/dehydratase family protein [Acidimicrobiales bacterium]
MLKNVIVTGGAGFIGGRVVQSLLQRGVDPVVIDHNRAQLEVESHLGGIEDPNSWAPLEGRSFDAIIHLAARTSVLKSVEDPHDVYLSNVAGSECVLEFARRNDIPSVVFASTNAAVGNTDDGIITETSPLRPLTPYGSTKAAAEMLASAYHNSYGIATAMLRLTNVYGPTMWNKDSIIPRLFRFARGKGSFSIYGDGEQVRDFVYVDDVARTFIELAERRTTTVVSYGSGSSLSVKALVELTSQISGVELEPNHIAPQAGEMSGVTISLQRSTELGLTTTVGLQEGLARTWEDFLRHEAG